MGGPEQAYNIPGSSGSSFRIGMDIMVVECHETSDANDPFGSCGASGSGTTTVNIGKGAKFKKIKSYKKEMTAEIQAQGQTFKMERTETYKAPSCFKAETIAMSSNMHALIVAPRAIVNPMAPDHESRSQRKAIVL